ncbi:MAG: hypothetical protein QOH70_1612 [Blastocatellia bacterium]|nr:hypothetical protein [Blastocatellia bacterium]
MIWADMLEDDFANLLAMQDRISRPVLFPSAIGNDLWTLGHRVVVCAFLCLHR